jgi:hypothetical protein
MALRSSCAYVIAAALLSMGAQYRTTNFTVDAPTPQIAQQVGQYAEHYRKEKAQQWLGHEMPAWPEPCPIKVKVTMGGAGGATSFAFDRGQVLGQHMNIEGSLDRLLASVLPHEVTHTVFAHYFRTPVPRWADEGGAVLSEDDIERNRHDRIVRDILNTPGRAIPLRRLFAMREYPSDVMVLYAEGFSVSDFLVSKSNRPAFLAFVAAGMTQGWDQAARSHYRYQSVEALEQDWLNHLRSTRQQPPTMLARNTTPPADNGQRVLVRQTVPPNLPTMNVPPAVVRGQSPEDDHRPTTLPGYGATAAAAPRDPWQPAATPTQHPQIRLGNPQLVAIPGSSPAAAAPPPISPANSPQYAPVAPVPNAAMMAPGYPR